MIFNNNHTVCSTFSKNLCISSNFDRIKSNFSAFVEGKFFCRKSLKKRTEYVDMRMCFLIINEMMKLSIKKFSFLDEINIKVILFLYMYCIKLI